MSSVVEIFARLLRFAAGHLAAGFFASLLRVASGDLLVPGGVEGPGPGFADCSANHCIECARLADRAQVDVDEDSAEHDYGGDVVYDIADSYGGCAECSCPCPQDDACDQVHDAADNDFPELSFLSGVEEAGVGRIHFFFAAGDLLYVAHPLGIGCGPNHRLDPV